MSEKAKPFIKGYKYRFYPTTEQKEQLAKIFGSCRYVYNRLLAEAIEDYKKHKESPKEHQQNSITGIGLCYKVTAWKNEEVTSWLKESPSQVIQQPAHHIAAAYKGLFKDKKGFPKFKSKHGKQSATFTTQSYTIKKDVVTLAKFEESLNIQWSRKLPTETPGPCSVSKTPTDKYYISFLCEYTPEKTTGTNVIGIDAGITDLATLSNGIFIVNIRQYVKSQYKLSAAQRSLSRKKKGSKNREKARLAIAEIHEKICNQRNDYLHKLTTNLIRENKAIGIETLVIRNMVKNHRLAKHILDAAWGKMRQYLIYKAVASQHTKIILADPYYPSTQLCSNCGLKPKVKLQLTIRKWECLHCGSVHQRDHNAAKNLEKLALSHLEQERVLGRDNRIILSHKYEPHLV